ncbi:MAG: penicillin-binding protein 1A [Oceanicoccus sp.]
MLILTSAYLYLSPNLPTVDDLRDVRLQTPLRVYTSDQKLIGEFGEERRLPITFDQMPPLFVNAILAIEDSRFYDHHGVDIKGLLRAVSQLLLTGEKGGGGSTITMQVAKNYFFSFEKQFSRKFSEILLSLQIERELGKNEIMELYANKIFLGKRAYGFEAAAQVYYGKSLQQLELPQFAMLAGLPQLPSVANPIINPARAIRRRNVVLGRMLELDFIDQDAYELAANSPVTASYHGPRIELSSPYVSEMVRKEMLAKYGRDAYSAGYSVYTTIDSTLQSAAQQSVFDGLLSYDQRHGYRGPEQSVLADSELENRDLWLQTLANTHDASGLLPAIVTTVDEQSFNALMKDGSEKVITWEHGLKGKRRYESVDRRSRSAKSASDLVATGDLIRIRQLQDGNWHLSQLPEAQAALVSLNADNGAILSLVGGFNYGQSKFNRITQATRQPGSNFKPFVYTAALANGYTPASIINDAPVVFKDEGLESTWRPTNSSGKFYGPTRLRSALFRSQNLVSIRLLRNLGFNNAIDYVERFGFDPDQLPRDLSLALGSHSVTPMQIVSGYSILANGGYKIEPYLIQYIEDIDNQTVFTATPDSVCRDCDTLEDPASEDNIVIVEETSPVDLGTVAAPNEAALLAIDTTDELATIEDILNLSVAELEPELILPTAERVVEARVAYIINSMMRDVVKKGTGRKALSLGRDDLAGKTGTSNGPTDAWFSGYGGGVVTTAWMGFDKNGLLGRNEYGGKAALPIWINYMRVALDGKPETEFKQPEGVVTVKIDPTTGLLAKPGQTDAIFEIFREEFAPTEEAGIDDIAGDTSNVEDVMVEDIF